MAKFTRHKKIAFLLVAPQLVITGLFFIWPALNALLQSFYFSDAFGLKKRFAGFVNYQDLVRDPGFIKAVIVTLAIAFFVTFLTLSFGLLLAVLVSRRNKTQAIYKSLLLWPYAVAPAIAAILWRFLCQPTLGWLPTNLNVIGIDFNYLIHPYQALTVVISSGIKSNS
jgi:sn-glycerol 3-phosphate transport system permease protein